MNFNETISLVHALSPAGDFHAWRPCSSTAKELKRQNSEDTSSPPTAQPLTGVL